MPTVFITGASRGIGLELARRYAAAGWRTMAGVRNPGAASELKAVTGEAFPLDVQDAASVAALARSLAGEPIDVLINNAGITGPKRQTALDMDFDGFLETLSVNTLGPLRVSQALLPNLRLGTDARIAVISSRMGSMANPSYGSVAYRASKAGVNKVVQCLAKELAPEGIAVATLHPGWVRTDMGGAGADIDVATSAAGIKAVIDKLDLAHSGQFWNYDGTLVPW